MTVATPAQTLLASPCTSSSPSPQSELKITALSVAAIGRGHFHVTTIMESSSSQLKLAAIFPSQQQQCCLHQHSNSGGRSSFQQKKQHLFLWSLTAGYSSSLY